MAPNFALPDAEVRDADAGRVAPVPAGVFAGTVAGTVVPGRVTGGGAATARGTQESDAERSVTDAGGADKSAGAAGAATPARAGPTDMRKGGGDVRTAAIGRGTGGFAADGNNGGNVTDLNASIPRRFRSSLGFCDGTVTVRDAGGGGGAGAIFEADASADVDATTAVAWALGVRPSTALTSGSSSRSISP